MCSNGTGGGESTTQIAQSDTDNSTVLYLRIVEQEVNRQLSFGVPQGLIRSDLISEAHEALAVALHRGNSAIRLAIRNALIDRVRHEAVRMRHSGDILERIADFGESVVGELVVGITPRQTQAVRLVYYFGMTEAEAAGEMECSQPVVHKILAAAIVALRKKLQDVGY